MIKVSFSFFEGLILATKAKKLIYKYIYKMCI